MGVLEERGGQQASCFVDKQAVEFPQVLAKLDIITLQFLATTTHKLHLEPEAFHVTEHAQ